MIRARKTSRWLLVLAFTMRLSSLCWLAVTSIGTGAGMIGTLPKALHYTISFMGHDTRTRPPTNGLLQMAKRIARGFRNFHYFRLAAYLKASLLHLQLPHPLPT